MSRSRFSTRSLCANPLFRSCSIRPGVFVALLVLLFSSSCVERFLRVRTFPEGATVYVNGRYAGESPVDYSFDHYGHYRLDVWMSGHASLSTIVEVEAPWYQVPPLDLFAELFDPRTHVDSHVVELPLEAGKVPPVGVEAPEDRALRKAEELLERSRAVRDRRS